MKIIENLLGIYTQNYFNMISVIIPTYEMGGVGNDFLKKSLYYLSNQTFKEFEVVISDHSVSKDIEEICKDCKNLDIRYIKNPNPITNNKTILKIFFIKGLISQNLLLDASLSSTKTPNGLVSRVI